MKLLPPKVVSTEKVTTRREPPSRLQELVVYFVISLGVARRTQLVHLVYLTDFLHLRFLGAPYTRATYLRQDRGPAPIGFDHEVGALDGFEIDITKADRYRLTNYLCSPGSSPRFQPSPSAESAKLLQIILSAFGSRSRQSLAAAVWDTPPMKQLLTLERRKRKKLLGTPIAFPLYPPKDVLGRHLKILSDIDLNEHGTEQQRRWEELDLFFEFNDLRGRANMLLRRSSQSRSRRAAKKYT